MLVGDGHGGAFYGGDFVDALGDAAGEGVEGGGAFVFFAVDGDGVLDAFDGQLGEVGRAGGLGHLDVSLASRCVGGETMEA